MQLWNGMRASGPGRQTRRFVLKTKIQHVALPSADGHGRGSQRSARFFPDRDSAEVDFQQRRSEQILASHADVFLNGAACRGCVAYPKRMHELGVVAAIPF